MTWRKLQINYIRESVSLCIKRLLRSNLLKARDRVSLPCETTSRFIVLYFIMFWGSKWETKDFVWTDRVRYFLKLICSKFVHGCNIDLLASIPDIWTLPHFSKDLAITYLNAVILFCILLAIRDHIINFFYHLLLDKPPSRRLLKCGFLYSTPVFA